MTTAPAARTFEVRHVQLARAAFAAIAAVMVTFSPDHSAAVGLAIFSGFAFLNALVLLVASGASTRRVAGGRRWCSASCSRRRAWRAGIAQLRTITDVLRHRDRVGALDRDHRDDRGRSRSARVARSRPRQRMPALRVARRPDDRHPHARARPRAAARADAVRAAVHDRGRERDVHPHRDHHRRRHLRRLRRDRRRLPRDRRVLAAQGAAAHDRGAGRAVPQTSRPLADSAGLDRRKGPA